MMPNKPTPGGTPQKSGFFDLPVQQTCRHPEHEPPSMLYIPPGKGYRHVCPGCGKTVNLYGSNITMR